MAMTDAPMRILLTGPPGCGKTTAVMKIAELLDKKLRLAGF
jgi:nucleoside-triphosphatase THEP1